MSTESNSEGDEGGESISIDILPDPWVRVVIRDGTAVLTNWNRRFAERFETTGSEMRFRDWWDTNELLTPGTGPDEIQDSLSTGEDIDLTLSERTGPVDKNEETKLRMRTAINESDTATDEYLFFTPPVRSGDEEVNLIASILSHDLRNPLDVAKAHLREARDNPRQKHFDQVAEAHDRMELIIRDVLTLAREGDAIDQSPDVDLERVARDAWGSVETEEASLVFVEELPTVQADADRLQRLFENLFRNSVEHANSHGGNSVGGRDNGIELMLGTTADGFYVADNGSGIGAPEREHVFEPGYSGDTDGTGLGLTIVDRIARAHDWKVKLTEDDSGGARFEFTLSDESHGR